MTDILKALELRAKQCNVCGVWKLLKEFYKRDKLKDKLRGRCKLCDLKINKIWQKNNAKRCSEKALKWRRAHPEQARICSTGGSRKYRENHPDKARAACARWARENPDKMSAKTAKRRARKRRLSPVWADDVLIKRIYKEVADLNAAGRTKFHVDHVIPLSKFGLHHENNLQILTAKQNLSKGAKLLPV